MPRQRLSIEQAKMRGSAAVNAGRFAERKKSPVTIGSVGPPPAHLDAEQKKLWKEIVTAIPAGVAGSADRIAIEVAATLLSQFRENPLMQAARIALLGQFLSRLGLDPQARTKLNAQQEPEPPESPWSKLVQ